MKLRYPLPILLRRKSSTPVQKLLSMAGLKYCAGSVTYMFYPNDPSRISGNRHYLYEPVVGWTAAHVTIDGTMQKDGTVTGGTGYAITAPSTTRANIQVYWLSGATKIPIFEIGLNRLPTEAEIVAIEGTAFLTSILAGTGVSAASCAVVDNYPYFDKGKVIFTWDDAFGEVFDNAVSIFAARSAKSTVYVRSNGIGATRQNISVGGYTVACMTWDELIAMAAAGHDIQCHTDDHSDMTAWSEAQTLTHLQAVNTAFAGAGMAVPTHIAYPGGQFNDTVKANLLAAGLRLTGRRTGPASLTYRTTDKYKVQSLCFDISLLNDTTMPTYKAWIDAAVAAKAAFCLYAHGCTVAGWDYGTKTTYLAELLDYCATAGADIITAKQMHAQMVQRVPATEPDVPVTATVAVNGDGVGIGVIQLSVSSDVRLTISGNARFYTDAAATLGESTTWDVVSGATRSRYIRCTSGTSTLTFSNNKLTQFISWQNISGNGPLLTMNTNIFPQMTLISVANNAALTIALGELSRELTSINYRANGTLSGELSTLPYPLTLFKVAGANALNGDVKTLPRGLTQVEVSGFNTFSGNIADLPSGMTWCLISGYNTLTGDLAAAPAGLTYFDIRGNNTISTYTGGRAWNANLNYLRLLPAAGSGLSVSELSALIADVDGSAWGGSSRTLIVNGNNASMADTNQGGIWGDFDGETTPSALATALKSLVRTKSVTVSLTGIAIPGGTGDGTGFPAGFGDWYRS